MLNQHGVHEQRSLTFSYSCFFLHFQDEELLQDRGSIEPGADSAEAPRGKCLDYLFVLHWVNFSTLDRVTTYYLYCLVVVDLKALPNAYYSTRILKDGIILWAEAQAMIKFEPVCPMPDPFGGKACNSEFCYKRVYPAYLLKAALFH